MPEAREPDVHPPLEVWAQCPACGRLWPLAEAPAVPACVQCGASLACVQCGGVATHNVRPYRDEPHRPSGHGLRCNACFMRTGAIVEGYGFTIDHHRGRRWTARDDVVLRAGLAAGRTAIEIGLAIMRTPEAVRRRARQLGLRRSRRRRLRADRQSEYPYFGDADQWY